MLSDREIKEIERRQSPTIIPGSTIILTCCLWYDKIDGTIYDIGGRNPDIGGRNPDNIGLVDILLDDHGRAMPMAVIYGGENYIKDILRAINPTGLSIALNKIWDYREKHDINKTHILSPLKYPK